MTARPTPSVSVVICAYTMRRWDVLVRAVEAARAQLRPDDELILVCDHSAELLAAATDRFVWLKLLSNPNGQGLSGARNAAVAASTKDVVAFLDDDAIPTDGWLDALRGTYADPAVIGAGGKVDAVWPDQPPPWLPPEFLWVVGCSYTGLPEEVSSVRNPIGANMSFRREAFTRAGLFSESLGRVGTRPVGCEETELSIRVGAQFPGSRILYQPAAVVSHHVEIDRTRVAYYYRRCWSEGRSKAVVSRLTQSAASLSAERAYATKTLSRALVRELSATLHGDAHALARAVHLTAGTAVTTLGYVRGRLL